MGFTGLAICRGGMTSDTLTIAASFAVMMAWMCIGCICLISEGYRVIQRTYTSGDTVSVKPYFGRPFSFDKQEVLRVERHRVPWYRHPYTLLDRVKNDNWCVQLEDGRTLFMNGRYFAVGKVVGKEAN